MTQLPDSEPMTLLIFDLYGDEKTYLNAGLAHLFLTRQHPTPTPASYLLTQTIWSAETDNPMDTTWPVITVPDKGKPMVISGNMTLSHAMPDDTCLWLKLGELDRKICEISRQEIEEYSNPDNKNHRQYMTALRVITPSGQELTFWIANHNSLEQAHQKLSELFKAAFGKSMGQKMAQRTAQHLIPDRPMLFKIDEAPYQLALGILPYQLLQNIQN